MLQTHTWQRNKDSVLRFFKFRLVCGSRRSPWRGTRRGNAKPQLALKRAVPTVSLRYRRKVFRRVMTRLLWHFQSVKNESFTFLTSVQSFSQCRWMETDVSVAAVYNQWKKEPPSRPRVLWLLPVCGNYWLRRKAHLWCQVRQQRLKKLHQVFTSNVFRIQSRTFSWFYNKELVQSIVWVYFFSPNSSLA